MLPVFDQGKAFVQGNVRRVWVEVDMPPIDIETQAESDSSPVLKNGMRSGVTDRLIGPNESYNYKTNPSASTDAGGWPIAGSMRAVRIVGDEEITQVLTEQGLEDQIENSMTRWTDEDAKRITGEMEQVASAINETVELGLAQDAALTGDVEAAPDLDTAQAEIIARVDSAGGEVLEFDQVDKLVDSDKIEELTVDGTIADRTAAGTLYTGIEGAQLDMAIPMLGGPFFPLRISNWENSVIWANRGESVNSAKEAKVTESGATHMMVLMGDPNMHVSNTTVSYAYIQTLFAAMNDPANTDVTESTMQQVTELLHNWNKNKPLVKPDRKDFTAGKKGQEKFDKKMKSYKNNKLIRKGVNEFPGFHDAAALIDYTHEISFDARKQIMKLMGNQNVEKITGISLQQILNATREQSLAGLGWGDGVLILEIDKSNMFTKLGEDGTTPHPDFPLGLRGKVVGKMTTPIGWQTLWQDWVKENKGKANLRRAFELSRPIVHVTKKLAKKIGDISAPGVPTRAHARMVVDAISGNWKLGTQAVKEGGLGPKLYKNAMAIADHGMIAGIRTENSGKEGLPAAVKNDEARIAQLGSAHVYYGMEKRGEDWALVGLINNDSGTEGLGETLAVLHAIENGATIAVADQSTMEYNLLKDLGFEEDGAVLRWKGTDNDRADLTQRYLRGGPTDVLTGGAAQDVREAAEADYAPTELGAEGQPQPDGRGVGAAQAGTDADPLASRARDVAQSLAGLNQKALDNLGVSKLDKKNIDQMELYQDEVQGPKGMFHQEKDTYGNIQNVITLADGADKSTFLHEMGHFWLYQMKTRLANPKLTAQGRRRLEQQQTSIKAWFGRNTTDAWRDIQIIAKSAETAADADPQDARKRMRAEQLKAAISHAKKNGGVKYMEQVAAGFMDGGVEHGTALEIGFHELWARGAEAYLFEGRAPSEALRKPMNKFSTWMIGVYAKIKNLNVTLDPEIRQVFDRLLATDAAINEERSKMLYQIPLELRAAATEKELQELDQLNVQAQTEAKAEMQGKVAKELLKERGAEYTAAKEKITAEVTEEVMSQPVYAYGRIVGQGVLTDGTEVKPGKPRLDRKEFEAIYGKDVAKKMPKYTFGKENIVEIDMLARAAGFDDVAHMISEMTQDHPSASVAIQTEVGRQLRAQFGSVLNPEQLTEDAEEVVQNEKQIELLALQAKIVRRLAREPIAKISKRKSLEEGAPSLDTDKIAASVAGTMEGFAETQGDAAPEQLRRVQIEEDTKANRDQRKAQSAAVKQVRQVTRSLDTEAIKEAAKRYVLKLPLGKLTPARFRQTAERLANKAQLAIAARKYDEAADLLQQRTLNLAIAREVAAAQTKATNTQRRHRRIVGRSDEKQGRDKDLVAIARSLLDKFGLIGEKRRGMPANEILARLKETDAALHSEMTELIAILSSTSDTYREADPDRPWRQMPLEEYIHLTAQIDAILKKALDEASILADGERVAFEQVGAEVSEATSDMTRDDRPAKARGGWAERVGMPTIGTIGSRLDRIELWARRMDGGDDGPMQRYLVRPMRQAIDSYHQARNDLSKQMLDILMPFKDELARKVRIEGGKELDGYFFRSKGELIHFLLHTGNASNERKLLLGSAVDTGNKYKYRWTTSTQQDEQVDTAQLDAFITRMVDEGVITPADIKMMNELWALFEQTKPAAQKAHKAMHGHYFEEIEGTARRTAAGVMNGGYVPAVYDNLQIVDGQKREAVESMDSAQNAAMFPSTDAGFTKGRVDYNQPLNLDLSMIPLHLNKVLRFSHLGPAVRMASRLTINKKFQAAVGKVDKYAIANLITPWLQRTARQTIAEPGIGLLDRIYTRASRNVGLQTMAGNLLNAAQQMTGLITASAVVPPHLIAKHTVTWRKDGESVRKFIISKSRFMNNRMYDSVNDMSATVGSILTATTPWSKADYYAGRFGYFAQQMAQNVVDPIVWMAAYDQAVETTYYQNVYNQYLETHGAQTALERADAAAVLYADRVVRDTQTPLGPEDVSAAEGTTAFGRLFMKFSSYFNNMRSLSKTEFSIAARNLGTEAARPGRRFMIYLTVIAMPSIVAEGIMMLGRGEFDDIDEMDEEELAIVMGKLLILSQVKMVGNFVPGVGAAVNWGVGQFTDAQYDDRLSASPVISIVDSGGKSLAGVLGDAYDLVTEGETDRSVARSVADILNAFGLIVGLPTNWFKKPTAYLIKVSEGDARPDGPADIVQGLLSGRDGTE